MASVLERIRENRTSYLYILPALAGLVFLVLYPFAFNIYISFTNMNQYHIRDYRFVGLQNYAFVFTDPDFMLVFRNTFVWTVVNVIPHVAIGLALALILNSKIRGKGIYRIFLIVPWAMPSFITLLIWRGMFNYQYGVINAFLGQFGMKPINWLGDPGWAFIGMVIANIWLGYSFMMIMFSGALQSIPNELYEAAAIDGAIGWREIRYITVPMLKPTIVIAALLGCIWTFNNFNAGYLVTGGGPGISTSIFITRAYNLAFSLFNFALSATYAFVAFLFLFAIGVAWTRYTGVMRRAV